MMVVLTLFVVLFGGPNVSFYDGMSGGPSFLAGSPAATAPATAPFDDVGSGGPSAIAPVAPPAPDGGSGGPSHP